MLDTNKKDGVVGEASFLLLGLSGIHHSADPIRVGHKAQGPVEPENPGLRIQSDIPNAFVHELLHQPLHHGPPQPDPLKRGVHHHVPYDRVEHAVAGGSGERHRPLRLGVLHPEQRVRVLERDPDLLRVPLREPDRHEDLVEVVQVQVRDRAVEEEAAGVEVLVGDRVLVGWRMPGNGDVLRRSGGGGCEAERRERSGDCAT